MREVRKGPTLADGTETNIVTHLPRRTKRKQLVLRVNWADWRQVSKLSAVSAVSLWGQLKLQSDLDRKVWIVPRLQMLREIGLADDRKKRKRAYDELEKAGLIEVYRRDGHPTKVKLSRNLKTHACQSTSAPDRWGHQQPRTALPVSEPVDAVGR